MRIISNGAICAVNAKEKRRLEKFRAAQERKVKMKNIYFNREITSAQYERGKENRGFLTREDSKTVLNDSERYGYGATAEKVYEENGKYYVRCHMYDSCD